MPLKVLEAAARFADDERTNNNAFCARRGRLKTRQRRAALALSFIVIELTWLAAFRGQFHNSVAVQKATANNDRQQGVKR
ncbi:MAG: hypothetical protein KGI92_10470 [Alphaproteobacteria bacterium]|nr:hypothetical protein [Alphaproteobacteria bacterium]